MKRTIELNYNPREKIVSMSFEDSGSVNFRITRTGSSGRVRLGDVAPFMLLAQKRILNEITVMSGGPNVVAKFDQETPREDYSEWE